MEFQEEIAVGYGVHAVGADGVEAELICNELAVEGVGDAGEGAAARGGGWRRSSGIVGSGACLSGASENRRGGDGPTGRVGRAGGGCSRA